VRRACVRPLHVAGDDRPWLLRMLREVHTMEAHQHPNIVDYKHAWIENHQMTQFGTGWHP